MTSGVRVGRDQKNCSKYQHDNFCQKAGNFCKQIKRVSFVKKIRKLVKKNNSLITNS
jgi:hypothetical protein